MSLRAPMAARRGRPRRCAGLRDSHQCHRRCAEQVPRQAGKHGKITQTFVLALSTANPPGHQRATATGRRADPAQAHRKPRYVRQMRQRAHDREPYRTAAIVRHVCSGGHTGHGAARRWRGIAGLADALPAAASCWCSRARDRIWAAWTLAGPSLLPRCGRDGPGREVAWI